MRVMESLFAKRLQDVGERHKLVTEATRSLIGAIGAMQRELGVYGVALCPERKRILAVMHRPTKDEAAIGI